MSRAVTRDEMLSYPAGADMGTSRWIEIAQPRIDAFADVTEDWQFIHVDPERAAQTAFGGTVAHGMLTLSMLSAMAYDALPAMTGQSASVNYGFDRVRFVAPVPAGARLRGRFTLAEATLRGRDKLMCRFGVSVEIEAQPRPALTADWLVLYVF